MTTSGDGKSAPRRHLVDQLSGRTIGDFEIFEEIGRGGMGAVFRARQTSLDRIVALKILSGNLGVTEASIIRFRREAQATAKLHHRNIVPIYAQGQEGPTYYYAMELLAGRSLADVIVDFAAQGGRPLAPPPARHPDTRGEALEVRPGDGAVTDLGLAETLPLDRAAATVDADEAAGSPPDQPSDSGSHPGFTDEYFDHIAAQMCDVADALDYAHCHGVIHRDVKPHNLLVAEDGRLCVSDFGLARMLEQPGVTVTGEFIGSPLYMSPEQMSSSLGQVTRRSDVYSLGATLYQWLTLSPPFPGQSREQVIARILAGDPTPPRSLNARVPVDLETICLKALEKEPHRRYQSAGEMRDDLARFLHRDRLKARRAGAVTRLGRRISRRRVAAVATVAAVLVAALLLEVARERHSVRQQEKTVATKQEEVNTVKDENVKLRQEREQLADAVAEMLQSRWKLGGDVGALVTKEFGATPLTAGLLSWRSADAKAYAPLTVAQRLGAMFLAALRTTELAAAQNVSTEFLGDGSAREIFLRGLRETVADQALADLDDCLMREPNRYEARLLRAWILCQASRGTEMLAEAQRLVDLDAQRPDGHVARAVAHLLLDDYPNSASALDKAAQLQGEDLRLDLVRGLLLRRLRQTEAALATLSRVLILEPDNVLALSERAALCLADGHVAAATADLTHALELEPRNADALEARGECYEALQKYNEAFADYLVAAQLSGRGGLLLKVARAAALRDQQRQTQAASTSQPTPAETDQPASAAEPAPAAAPRTWVQDLFDRGPHRTEPRASSGPRPPPLEWLVR